MSTSGPYVTVCFNAQQAIEKCLKAILAYRGAEVPKIHNLEDLRQRVAAIDPKLEIDPGVSDLNKYAVNGRYGYIRTDEEFAAWAVQLARTIRQRVVEVLPPEAIP